MTVFSTLRTDSREPECTTTQYAGSLLAGWRSQRPPRITLLAAAMVAAAAVLVLAVSSAASAGGATFAAVRSSNVDGDVLFWWRSYSIVKASVAAPALVATVLTGSTFFDPEVSPDGTKLAYSRAIGGNVNLEVRDLATGSTTVLATKTSDPVASFQLREPTWSPNSEAIAYVEVVQTAAEFRSVRVVAAAGGPSRLVDPSGAAAAWRPDGKLTVARFNIDNGAHTGLWITGVTPDDAVLVPGSEGARDHAWSPDGTQVVFSKIRNPDSTSIHILPAAGGKSTVLVPVNTDWKGEPVWSSDSQRIYYTHQVATESSTEIKQVPRTGGAVTTVVTGGYNFSPSITTKVAAPVRSASHDFTGDGYADVIGRMSNGDLRLYYGNGLGLSGYRRIGTGWSGMTAIFTPGDFNSDGHNDVIGRLPNGDLRLYTGVGGGPGGSQLIGTGFGGMTAVFSPGDFTGDGHPDVIARTSTGQLRLYVGTGVRLTGGTVIGPSGWNGISAVFSPGDFNGDDHPDVIGRLPGGELVVYYGNGVRLSGSDLIGTGWNGLTALFSPGDFNLDGKPDVIGRISNGDLRLYYGTGTRLSGYRTIGTGWNAVNPIL